MAIRTATALRTASNSHTDACRPPCSTDHPKGRLAKQGFAQDDAHCTPRWGYGVLKVPYFYRYFSRNPFVIQTK